MARQRTKATVTISYDRPSDTLYLLLEESEPGFFIEERPGTLIRISAKTNKPIGICLDNFLKRSEVGEKFELPVLLTFDLPHRIRALIA